VGQMHSHDAVFQAESLSSQPSSLGSGHSPTVAYVGEHQYARRLHRWTSRLRLVMRSSPGDTPIQERAFVVLGRLRLQGCIPGSLGLICGLIRVNSAASAVGSRASAQAEPDPTEPV
jgi:hypothetical protein